MKFFRDHWYDIGAVLALCAGAVLFTREPFTLTWLLWANLTALFLHQFEEYRWPGYFPGMFNSVVFRSGTPDRFPLNTRSSFIINTSGWAVYLLAAVLGERALWLGIAAVAASAGNFLVHTFAFNIRGRTLYNPGMLTSVVLFLPVSAAFFHRVAEGHLASAADWAAGLALGLFLSAGIIVLVRLLRDEQSAYVFPGRSVRR